MRNYDLYTTYALRFGLTFLPRGLSDAAWEAAVELMVRALKGMGPMVTHALIDDHLSVRSRDTDAACVA